MAMEKKVKATNSGIGKTHYLGYIGLQYEKTLGGHADPRFFAGTYGSIIPQI